MGDIAGLSTLGVTVWQAESTDGGKVADASAYSQLTRINSISEVSVSPEGIDASALEDMISRFVAGRSTITDRIDIVVNATNETIAEWEAILGKRVCIMIDVPELTDGYFVVVQVPSILPIPSIGQNNLFTMTVPCVVNDLIGLDTKIAVGA